MILLTLLIFSLIVSRAYTKNLRRSVKNAPRTDRSSAGSPEPAAQFPKVSVIVPAYNEAENIWDCAIAILESTPLTEDNLEVLIVDESIDRRHQGDRANPATAAGRPPPKNISRSATTNQPILDGQKLGLAKLFK